MDDIHVIGHKNPDTDTVVSAMAMAHYLNLLHEDNKYIANRPGEFNNETEFVFNAFGLTKPPVLDSAEGLTLYLVDHNESNQIIDGAETSKIAGIIDHHKVNFDGSKPIEILTRPWGSTCTVIYDLCRQNAVELPGDLLSGMLCAILSDTVILRSPTTTKHDRDAVIEIAGILDLDYQKLGMEMFTAKAQISDKTPEQIIHNDFKVFEFGEKIVGIGQIEAPDLSLLDDKLDEIAATMLQLKEENNYHTFILMLTDIIQEGTKLLVFSDDEEKIAEIFKTSITSNMSEFLQGVLSRKKQVVPVLNDNL